MKMTVTATVEVPENTPKTEMETYVKDALTYWGSGLYPEDRLSGAHQTVNVKVFRQLTKGKT